MLPGAVITGKSVSCSGTVTTSSTEPRLWVSQVSAFWQYWRCIHEVPCLQRQTAGVQSQFGIQLRQAGVHRWLRVAAIGTAVSQTEIFASLIFQTNIMYVCCPRSTEKLDSHEDDFKKTYSYSAPCLCASCLPGFVGLRCWADVCQ